LVVVLDVAILSFCSSLLAPEGEKTGRIKSQSR
jgi:hypothetical protein